MHRETEGYVLVVLDLANYYNSIDKAACFNAGQTLGPIARVSALVFGETKRSVIYKNKDANTVYRFEAPNGTIQGLGLSGYCAAKAANDVIASQSRFP